MEALRAPIESCTFIFPESLIECFAQGINSDCRQRRVGQHPDSELAGQFIFLNSFNDTIFFASTPCDGARVGELRCDLAKIQLE
jgi:hypothetical protein